MMKLLCSARIPNEAQRKSVMRWIRSADFDAYSELGDRVFVSLDVDNNDPEGNARKWGVIHTFESFPEHTVNLGG